MTAHKAHIRAIMHSAKLTDGQKADAVTWLKNGKGLVDAVAIAARAPQRIRAPRTPEEMELAIKALRGQT